MSSAQKRESFALSGLGLPFLASRHVPSDAELALFADPAVVDWWEPGIDYGPTWLGRKAGIPAALVPGATLPIVRTNKAGQSFATFGPTNLTPAVFGTPAASALWPLASDYTLLIDAEMPDYVSNVGAFFGNNLIDASITGGANAGCAWTGFISNNGQIQAHHQSRNGGAAATAIISTASPNLFPVGRQWFSLSGRYGSPGIVRELASGIVVRSNTSVAKWPLNSRLMLGGNWDGTTIERPLKGVRVFAFMVLNAAIGESDQSALLAKLATYFEARRLAAA